MQFLNNHPNSLGNSTGIKAKLIVLAELVSFFFTMYKQ